MNFLAHLYFADASPESMLGSVLPDLVRGPVRDLAAPATADAARLHRIVDRFTDSHPMFLRSRRRVAAEAGRWSGVVVDILYDHLLSRTWPSHSDEPLDRFVGRAYASLSEAAALAPPAVRPRLRRMVEQDWLRTYGTVEGIRLTLARVSTRISWRLSRQVDLTSTADALRRQGGGLGDDFRDFFENLKDRVAQERRSQAVRAAP